MPKDKKKKSKKKVKSRQQEVTSVLNEEFGPLLDEFRHQMGGLDPAFGSAQGLLGQLGESYGNTYSGLAQQMSQAMGGLSGLIGGQAAQVLGGPAAQEAGASYNAYNALGQGGVERLLSEQGRNAGWLSGVGAQLNQQKLDRMKQLQQGLIDTKRERRRSRRSLYTQFRREDARERLARQLAGGETTVGGSNSFFPPSNQSNTNNSNSGGGGGGNKTKSLVEVREQFYPAPQSAPAQPPKSLLL